MQSTDIQDASSLSKVLTERADLTAVKEDQDVMEAAARMLVDQAQQIETLRELKDGYYSAMALWREAKRSGLSFEEVQAKAAGNAGS